MPLNVLARSCSLSSQVARQLEQLITSGQWPVGKRIPAESELAAQLGLSRNTIREALRSLIHLGLLEARVGNGTYVQALSELEAPLTRRVRRAQLQEAVELRGVLERAQAGLAAQRRTVADVTSLRDSLAALRKACVAGDARACALADARLHRAVANAAGNVLLGEVYDNLGGALQLSVSPQLWDRELARRELGLHEALIEAIVKGDAPAAEAASTALLESLSASLLPRSSIV